jgi:ferrous iron transport protein B
MKKVLLMGDPNVGKSALFSRLTGVDVLSSNYPGTTVSYTKGSIKLKEGTAELIDVPGTYSLQPRSEAEKIAVKMLDEGDFIINVVDSTNLERNLYLTLELLERGRPMIVALNMWDDAAHLGITIDAKKLEKMLGVPVVPTVGVTGEGVKELGLRLSDAKVPKMRKQSEEDRWASVGLITSNVQVLTHRHHTYLERLADASINPLTGIPIAMAVLYLMFMAVITIGDWVINNIIDPLFTYVYGPFIFMMVERVFPSGMVHNILLGTSRNMATSMGVLTTGIYVEFDMVLPFVILFYFTLSLLEDVGYLPRLATLIDSVMHRIGLHGSAVVPSVLGLGCNVPGILATRILDDKKQRFIAATLLAICVPCLAKNAVITGLLLRYGLKYLAMVYVSLAAVYIVIGLLLNKLIKGESPEILLEIPPYRWPSVGSLLKKTLLRVRYFLVDATPFVLLGVLIVNVLYLTGVVDILAKLFSPILSGWFGLPNEAILALIIGFIRKDVAVGMLAPLNLSPEQLVVACTVLAMYFPCIATFTALLRELGWKDMMKSLAIMAVATFIVGGLLRIILL